ncbi:outer membrane lipid asymmetry maintenance protein MlaD [Pseudoduganella umbonata]|uniref:Outer membrane lipid asymmetry maintenance protein MlaD n=1 Tax=Pseudoduganella umbonata TaxID=864828 RepID=A0A4P8HVH1_9BURK|nr:outer membrane lipid asymmetry maintenance protein MlaD [Pseudoduganella umbonata]MBB3224099.1 phospholipid/cholesterol/gamma-HCH transport system substrate-binding protein [Pseudoduganella umbonata]QCP14037.1 outer membrane lipid asymmetry maintenance protein MlaD [Pseudoduganella umbonata]
MNGKRIEILVGGFVLSGMTALGVLAVHAADLGSLRGGETYALTARFDNIGGLKPRAPVRAAGVTVGRVRTIAFDPASFQGLVTLDIGADYRFPRDTAAKILSAGLLGDQFVGLEAGGEDRDLAAGDAIAQTQSAVVLENLISQFMSGQAAGAAAPAGAEAVE